MTGWVVRAFYQLSNRDSEPRAGQEVAPTVTSRGYRQDHLASSSGNLIPTAEPQLWHRIAPTGEMPATSVRRRISLFNRSLGWLDQIWRHSPCGKLVSRHL
ncbi:hypothetical protein BJY21_002198 [Kineosphaera limosa]|nr:hypothetical protein [Kineosphaera limosa]